MLKNNSSITKPRVLELIHIEKKKGQKVLSEKTKKEKITLKNVAHSVL
jgi:hypothetical protein